MVSVLILTKNEEFDLPGCLNSVNWCDDIHVFDSFSNDKTCEIALNFGATVTQRYFDNWSTHQNWGLSNIKFKYEWVLYIDADERVSPNLKSQILNFDFASSANVAYKIYIRYYSWNNNLMTRAQLTKYYLRLFKPDKIKYERLVNPIVIANGSVSLFDGYIDHFPFSKGIQWWFQRHLSYADMEARTNINDLVGKNKFSIFLAIFCKDKVIKRYHLKGLFYKLPFRPVIKWYYMVFIRGCFLDGKDGIHYATMQSIYEYFIVLKTRELLKSKSNKVL